MLIAAKEKVTFEQIRKDVKVSKLPWSKRCLDWLRKRTKT